MSNEHTPFLKEFLKLVSLVELRVVRLSAQVLAQPPAEGQVQINTQVGIENQPPTFVVIANVEITGADKSAANPYLRMELGVLARYQLTQGTDLPDSEKLLAFAQRVGIPHVWPYARVLAHSLSLQLGLQPVVLPLMLPEQSWSKSAPPPAGIAEQE